MTDRRAALSRSTSESTVEVTVNLDGSGQSTIDSSIGFYDHMLTALSRHSLIDLTIVARGDTDIDGHHVIEDTAIVLGLAIKQALGDKVGITRFGEATVPLDEALAQAIIDVSGRPFFAANGEPEGQVYARIGGSGVPYQGSMTYHLMEALALNAGLCLHLRLMAGRDPHHIVEAQFKAVARALRQAISLDPRVVGVPSTKGSL
ncbi:MAG: imidazoleglycerol-phosphate dehydratase HisB [Propionibacteriaceae bacterium]|jgi:imidazoleglycerol-phosphate dehydratase|nr:imidazoleglycerol-phosphate dehydratase HisB [Propionibacteriaceae bacterium]